MTIDDEDLSAYEVRDLDLLRQGSEIMAMALAEIGYETEKVGPHLRVLDGRWVTDEDLYRAQNIGRRRLGLLTFPDIETARRFWEYARMNPVA